MATSYRYLAYDLVTNTPGVHAALRGSHTFALGAPWANDYPAVPTQPLLTDPFLMVIPID